MSLRVVAVARPDLPPFAMPDRFRHDITYFMSIPGELGVPQLPSGEYWVRLDDARRWLDDGVLRIVSPLDSENQTEVEITEEQEDWLRWIVENGVEHLRIS